MKNIQVTKQDRTPFSIPRRESTPQIFRSMFRQAVANAKNPLRDNIAKAY